jgi:hypothetical protein
MVKDSASAVAKDDILIMAGRLASSGILSLASVRRRSPTGTHEDGLGSSRPEFNPSQFVWIEIRSDWRRVSSRVDLYPLCFRI